jgi:hypothetical protein
MGSNLEAGQSRAGESQELLKMDARLLILLKVIYGNIYIV